MHNFLLFATKNGFVKKTPLEEYTNIRTSGLVAIKLDMNDQLLDVSPTSGEDEILLISANGKSILFDETNIRPTGRASRGVKGINLKKGDSVIGMDIIRKDEATAAQKYEVLVISENGYGKKTRLSEYSRQGRGGQGVFTAKLSSRTGKLIDMRLLRHDHEEGEPGTDPHDLLVISIKGQTIRLPVSDVPVLGRHTQGVRILKLNSGDRAAALAIL